MGLHGFKRLYEGFMLYGSVRMAPGRFFGMEAQKQSKTMCYEES